MSEISAEEKAKQLVNMYYAHSNSQLEAIEIAERVVLGTLCERVDSLHGHVFFNKDYDIQLIESAIKQLKSWQEVATELNNIKRIMAI